MNTTSLTKMQRELVAVTEERDRLAEELQKLRAAPSVPEECQNCKKAWAMNPIAWYRKRSDGGIEGPLMDDDSRMCTFRRKEWTPLYERPFYPDFLNYRQGFNDGIEEIRYELKQLCKDFSDLQNRPYMGDVHTQVDAICDRALLQSADHSERLLEMVTPEFRNSAKDSGV